MDNRPYVSSRSSSGGQRPKWPCSRPPRRELLRRLLFYLTRAHYTHTRSQATCLSHALEEEQRDRHGIQGLPARISQGRTKVLGLEIETVENYSENEDGTRVVHTTTVNRISENCMKIWETRFPDFLTFIVSNFLTFVCPSFQTFKPSNFQTLKYPNLQISSTQRFCIFKLPNFQISGSSNFHAFGPSN